jgi:hypothetical protein
MRRYLFSFILGIVIVAVGVSLKPNSVALGSSGPYVLTTFMWVTIIVFMMLWRKSSFSTSLSSIIISSAICAPIMAYMANQWLGIVVGLATFYLATRWAQNLTGPPPNAEPSE